MVVAFARWTWGVSPAFVTADSDIWYLTAFFGAVIDVAAVAVLTAVVVSCVQIGRSSH